MFYLFSEDERVWNDMRASKWCQHFILVELSLYVIRMLNVTV